MDAVYSRQSTFRKRPQATYGIKRVCIPLGNNLLGVCMMAHIPFQRGRRLRFPQTMAQYHMGATQADTVSTLLLSDESNSVSATRDIHLNLTSGI